MGTKAVLERVSEFHIFSGGSCTLPSGNRGATHSGCCLAEVAIVLIILAMTFGLENKCIKRDADWVDTK